MQRDNVSKTSSSGTHLSPKLTDMVRIFPLKVCFVIAHHLLKVFLADVAFPILVKSIEHDVQRSTVTVVLRCISPVRFLALAAHLSHLVAYIQEYVCGEL